MNNKIKEISVISFRELVRDRVFLVLALAALFLVFSSLILNEMVVGVRIKAIKDLGLTVMNLFPLVILIFMGINLISKDLNRKSLYFIFSKPVKRSEYLIGSSLSVFGAMLLAIFVIALTLFFISLAQGEAWLAGLAAAVYLTLLEMTLMLSFAVLFSVITSYQLGMFLTLIIYIVGHTIEKAVLVVTNSGNGILKYFLTLLYPLLPNLDFYNRKPEIVYGSDLPVNYFIAVTCYTIAYSTLLYLISLRVFKGKEI